MKIQGSLDLVQTNLDFYLRLTSTSKYRKVEDLRSYYYNNFLEEAKRGLKSTADSKQEVVEVIKKEVDLVESTITEETTTSCASSFLSTIKSMNDIIEEDIKPVPGLCLDDIIDVPSSSISLVDVHGIILDDYVVEVNVYTPTSNYTQVSSIVKEDIHGTILDDYKVQEDELYDIPNGVPEYKPITNEVVHGIILDDYVPLLKPTTPEVVEEFVYVDESEESYVYDEEESVLEVEDEFIEEEFVEEEFVEEDFNFDFSYPESSEVSTTNTDVPSNIISISDRIKVVEPQEFLPPTVREYLKKHPGARVSDVEKLYTKKVVKKELTMGKIYKKGDKLFI